MNSLWSFTWSIITWRRRSNLFQTIYYVDGTIYFSSPGLRFFFFAHHAFNVNKNCVLCCMLIIRLLAAKRMPGPFLLIYEFFSFFCHDASSALHIILEVPKWKKKFTRNNIRRVRFVFFFAATLVKVFPESKQSVFFLARTKSGFAALSLLFCVYVCLYPFHSRRVYLFCGGFFCVHF